MHTLSLAIGLALSLGAIAQSTHGEIKGQLFNEMTGEPVLFANVYIDMENGEIFGTTTDLDGRFTLKPLVSGSYTVNFSYTGFTDVKISGVIVKPDQIAWLRHVDIAEGVYIGEGAEVVAYVYEQPLINPEEPSKMVVLFKQIENSPVARNPENLIQSIAPGVSGGNGDGEIYFRGTRSGASVYFVDGVKLTGGLANVPRSSMGSITVYTGGIPAKYGDTTGGVVAVETKSYFDLLRQWRIEESKKVEQPTQ